MFSSRGTAAGASEARRFTEWWDEYASTLSGREAFAEMDRPFAANIEYVALGEMGLGRGAGSITRVERRRDHVAQDSDDRFALLINRGTTPYEAIARSGSTIAGPGSAVLFDYAEPAANVSPDGRVLLSLMVPRRLMLAGLKNAEDVTGTVLPAENQALRLLCHFADPLFTDDSLTDAPLLTHAGQTLVDLVVLAFGTDRDNAEIARLRGLRAARLAAVLRHIRRDYTNPELSPEIVATRVGISTRTLHELLHQTGSSFAERVRHLRLAKVFALLCTDTGEVRTVSDAAFAAGFNDLSHFNHLFRRHYGLTPRAARGRRGPTPH